jgi:hypothetical protein
MADNDFSMTFPLLLIFILSAYGVLTLSMISYDSSHIQKYTVEIKTTVNPTQTTDLGNTIFTVTNIDKPEYIVYAICSSAELTLSNPTESERRWVETLKIGDRIRLNSTTQSWETV